jgi:hypothetical protein
MTKILGKFTKQPDEILDYDVDYTDWFENREDSPASFTVAAEPGITIVSSGMAGPIVKVVLAGGTHGEKYKITVLLTTDEGLVKEADFTVTIKAI